MKYKVEIIKSRRKTLAIEVKPDGRIIARAPIRASRFEINRFISEKSEWIEKQLEKLGDFKKLTEIEKTELYARAKEYIPSRVAYFAELGGIDYGKITIKIQKTKWGSCSAKGNLNFNCLLMLTPSEVIDSVIVHELCHRKEMNHSKRFYNEVLKLYPEYYEAQKWLKANGAAIMGRAY